jgi:hypothetical protein
MPERGAARSDACSDGASAWTQFAAGLVTPHGRRARRAAAPMTPPDGDREQPWQRGEARPLWLAVAATAAG